MLMKTCTADMTYTLTLNKRSRNGTTPTKKHLETRRHELFQEADRYLPIVRKIVGGMRAHLPAHADFEELISVGVSGLMSAITKYDREKGETFETYASIRIRGAILDELRRLDWMPRSIRTKYRNLQKTVQMLEQELGRTPIDSEIREALGLTEKKYRKMRAQTSPISMIFLDRAVTGDESNLHEAIADEKQPLGFENLERTEMLELITERIDRLPDRQRRVLAMYYQEGMRLAEIAEVFSLSEARISQIHSQALSVLRVYLRRMTRG